MNNKESGWLMCVVCRELGGEDGVLGCWGLRKGVVVAWKRRWNRWCVSYSEGAV